MGLIFVSSSIPSYDFPDVGWWGWAKVIHLIYFGVLCFLFRKALQEQKQFSALTKNPILFAILFATVYGVMDEVHQIFTPGRHAMVTDVLVDALGACLYVAVARTYEFFRLKRADAA
jgi:VanZ family protein